MRLERWSLLSVSRVRYPKLLKLPEQVVHRLFGHARLGREFRWALVLWAGVPPHINVGCDEVGEAAVVQANEHSVAHRLPWDS